MLQSSTLTQCECAVYEQLLLYECGYQCVFGSG